MEIRPINLGLIYPTSSEEKTQQNSSLPQEDIYELDIEVNLREKNHTTPNPEETSVGCQTYGCGYSNGCTQPNSQCICSGVNCGGTVCSHC